MKTLELKDICGYLPYGLRIMRSPTNVPVVAELLDIRKDFTILGAGHIDTYRAVLRPMSDLTKEIRQNCYNNSKPFIPIVELACMLEAQGYWRVYGAGAADFGEDGESCIAQLVFDGDHFVYTVDDEYDTFNSVAIYDKLNAWMFDYRGLISAGLAIDVNTLPENPYER